MAPWLVMGSIVRVLDNRLPFVPSDTPLVVVPLVVISLVVISLVVVPLVVVRLVVLSRKLLLDDGRSLALQNTRNDAWIPADDSKKNEAEF